MISIHYFITLLECGQLECHGLPNILKEELPLFKGGIYYEQTKYSIIQHDSAY